MLQTYSSATSPTPSDVCPTCGRSCSCGMSIFSTSQAVFWVDDPPDPILVKAPMLPDEPFHRRLNRKPWGARQTMTAPATVKDAIKLLLDDARERGLHRRMTDIYTASLDRPADDRYTKRERDRPTKPKEPT